MAVKIFAKISLLCKKIASLELAVRLLFLTLNDTPLENARQRILRQPWVRFQCSLTLQSLVRELEIIPLGA